VTEVEVVLEVELDVEVVDGPNAVDRIAETMSGTKPAPGSLAAGVVATVAVVGTVAGFFGSFVAAGGVGVGMIMGVGVTSKNS
jgi:hypothetical protein